MERSAGLAFPVWETVGMLGLGEHRAVHGFHGSSGIRFPHSSLSTGTGTDRIAVV